MQDKTLQHLNSPEDKEEIYNKLCSASALMEEARSGIAFLDEVKEDLPSAKQRLIYLCFWIMIVRTVSKALEVSMLSEDLYRIYLVSRGRKAQKYFKMIIFDKCEQTYVYSAIGTYMPNIFAMYQNNIDIDKYEGEELIQWVLSVIKKELEKMIISSHGMTQSRSDIVVDLIHYTQENIQLFSVYRNNAIINEEAQFTLGERYIVDFATAGDVDVEDNPNGVDNKDNFFYLGESIGAGLGVGATVFGLSGTWSENGIVSTIIDKLVGLVNTMGGIGAGLFNSLAKIEDLDKIQEEGAAFMVDVSDIVLRAESIPMNEGFGLMNMLQYQKIETLIENVVSERTKLLIKMNEALEKYIDEVIVYSEEVKKRICSDLVQMELNRQHTLMLRSYLTKLSKVNLMTREIKLENNILTFFKALQDKVIGSNLKLSLDGLKAMILEIMVDLNKQ